MAGEKYGGFDELRNREREGSGFHHSDDAARDIGRDHRAARGNDRAWHVHIAAAIAGNDYGLYCFEGLRKRPDRNLHITSAISASPGRALRVHRLLDAAP